MLTFMCTLFMHFCNKEGVTHHSRSDEAANAWCWKNFANVGGPQANYIDGYCTYSEGKCPWQALPSFGKDKEEAKMELCGGPTSSNTCGSCMEIRGWTGENCCTFVRKDEPTHRGSGKKLTSWEQAFIRDHYARTICDGNPHRFLYPVGRKKKNEMATAMHVLDLYSKGTPVEKDWMSKFNAILPKNDEHREEIPGPTAAAKPHQTDFIGLKESDKLLITDVYLKSLSRDEEERIREYPRTMACSWKLPARDTDGSAPGGKRVASVDGDMDDSPAAGKGMALVAEGAEVPLSRAPDATTALQRVDGIFQGTVTMLTQDEKTMLDDIKGDENNFSALLNEGGPADVAAITETLSAYSASMYSDQHQQAKEGGDAETGKIRDMLSDLKKRNNCESGDGGGSDHQQSDLAKQSVCLWVKDEKSSSSCPIISRLENFHEIVSSSADGPKELPIISVKELATVEELLRGVWAELPADEQVVKNFFRTRAGPGAVGQGKVWRQLSSTYDEMSCRALSEDPEGRPEDPEDEVVAKAPSSKPNKVQLAEEDRKLCKNYLFVLANSGLGQNAGVLRDSVAKWQQAYEDATANDGSMRPSNGQVQDFLDIVVPEILEYANSKKMANMRRLERQVPEESDTRGGGPKGTTKAGNANRVIALQQERDQKAQRDGVLRLLGLGPPEPGSDLYRS
ncbi:unnamed protein product [Amoebophrya sp. A25]|nr:unnamed protein product [Amoebophrya sp. A25]|eukprot:GSA25T00012468001.1